MNLLKKLKKIGLLFCLVFSCHLVNAQICGTPGLDGTVNNSAVVNTYFPAKGEIILTAGNRTLNLDAVPVDDGFGNSYGKILIHNGDLLLIIQIQDATIAYTNNALYGANNPTSGPDLLGGTGYTDLGNSGKFEYIIATSDVPLTGGTLTFKGLGPGNGVVNTYVNAKAIANHGARTFQVVRVPQYSNLLLSSDIITPSFNGKAGGIIAFDVAGTMNFNGFKVDASARGFRGGSVLIGNGGQSFGNTYVTVGNDAVRGKGEGIAGIPRNTWDGVNEMENYTDPKGGLPGGSYGKGAPGNGGGGSIDEIAGGAGGGNGGAGGSGGSGPAYIGRQPNGNGGRPGINIYFPSVPDQSLLTMGGGGGSGGSGVLGARQGGVGGGIVLINVNRLTSSGTITSNGGNAPFEPRNGGEGGAGGGGAGGTIFFKVIIQNPASLLSISAKGGNGAGLNYSDIRVLYSAPGGGGGGGQIFHNLQPSLVNAIVEKGKAGIQNIRSSNDPIYFAADGQDGNIVSYSASGNLTCYPELTTIMSQLSSGSDKYSGSLVTYQIKATNKSDGGNAGGVQLDVQLPAGFSYHSATVTYSGDSGGPQIITNVSGNANRPLLGDFNIPPGGEVTITLVAKVDCPTLPGTYHSSAAALYLDPTRTSQDPERKITPSVNAFPGAKTNYEADPNSSVPGANYDGKIPSANAEDVTIRAFTISNNIIHAPQLTVFCTNGDPDIITGELPAGGEGNFTYQWQQSADNITFNDIPGQAAKDFDPGVLTIPTYYRRMVFLDCAPTSTSNVVFINVISPLPEINFDIPDVCLKDGLARFANKTVISDGSEARLTYQWDFGDAVNATPANPNTSTDKDGTHIYTHIGNYTISLTVRKDGACPKILQQTFRVNGSIPKAGFTLQNTKLCSGQEFIFEDKATVDFGEITRIEWYYDYGNNPSVVEIDNHPATRAEKTRLYKHSYPLFRTPASKTVTFRMVVYSGNSCVDEKQADLNLQAVPEAVFAPIPSICQQAASFQLTQGTEIWGVLTGTGKYSGPGVDAKGIFDPNAAGPGTHTMTYTFLADNGCTSDAKVQTITVFPGPTVNAGNDQSIIEGEQIQLSAIVTGSNLSYKWTPATALDRDDILNPIATPTQDITYKLTLTTDQGCTASDQVLIRVVQNFEIPNTFTPNGDNINDEWNIKYLSSYPKATINVFNRYGERVFGSTANKKSWDGKYQGVDVPVGTYFYIIDPHNGRKALTGTLTILR